MRLNELWRRWLGQLRSGRRPYPRPTPQPHGWRPLLEVLEGRAVPSLISGWTANHHTTASITGLNNGTLQGAAGYGSGVIGDAFNFSGGYFQAPTVDLPTGDHPRTLDLWVNIRAFGSGDESFFAGYGTFGSDNETYQLGANANATVFFSQWGQSIAGPALATGTWYNVAVTSEGNSETLYLNGQSVATGSLPISTPANTQLYMGTIPGGLGTTRILDGEVDQVYVYSTALTQAEIQQLYLAGLGGHTAAPLPAAAVTPDLTSLVTATAIQAGLQAPNAAGLQTPNAAVSGAPDKVAGPGPSLSQASGQGGGQFITTDGVTVSLDAVTVAQVTGNTAAAGAAFDDIVGPYPLV
jgi:hypothetical protein